MLRFALPTLGANVLQSLNGSINMVWIGRFLGEDALAASSNASIVLFLALSGVFGFGMAGSIVIAQQVGRRDIDAARKAMGASAGIFLVMSTIVTIAGWFYTDAVLQLLGTPAVAMPLASTYLHVIFLALPGMFVSTLLMMGLRGAGDSMTPLIFMGLSAVLDAGLNPLLIAGIGPFPHMGIAGAGVATMIANYATAAGLLAYIYARDLPIRLRGAEWRYLLPELTLLKLILSKGLIMGLQMLVMTASGLVMITLVNQAGIETTAAYGVTAQIWTYVQMPAMAISAAVSAMAAQNIGAGRWDRVGSIARQGIIANVVLGVGSVALIAIFDEPILALFLGSGSPAIPIAAHIHIIAGWAFVITGAMMVLFGVVRANGAVLGPLIAMFIGQIPVRLGFALAGQPYLGLDALWWAFPASSIVAMAIAVAYYRYANWRGKALVDEAELLEGEMEMVV